MTALERNIDHWMMNWALDVAALCVFDSEVRRGYGYVSDPGRLRNGYVLRFYDGGNGAWSSYISLVACIWVELYCTFKKRGPIYQK